jgi:hypothetical protein
MLVDGPPILLGRGGVGLLTWLNWFDMSTPATAIIQWFVHACRLHKHVIRRAARPEHVGVPGTQHEQTSGRAGLTRRAGPSAQAWPDRYSGGPGHTIVLVSQWYRVGPGPKITYIII